MCRHTRVPCGTQTPSSISNFHQPYHLLTLVLQNCASLHLYHRSNWGSAWNGKRRTIISRLLPRKQVRIIMPRHIHLRVYSILFTDIPIFSDAFFSWIFPMHTEDGSWWQTRRNELTKWWQLWQTASISPHKPLPCHPHLRHHLHHQVSPKSPSNSFIFMMKQVNMMKDRTDGIAIM